MPNRYWQNLILAGLIAGTLDIAYACLFWSIKVDLPATRIFQSVAAGLLGPASFDGGLATATLGLALHFAIALAMSAAYFFAAAKWGLLWRRPLVFGAVYGSLLYLFMHFVVVPLSAASSGSSDPSWIWMSVLVHMFFVGVPIAWFTRRAFE